MHIMLPRRLSRLCMTRGVPLRLCSLDSLARAMLHCRRPDELMEGFLSVTPAAEGVALPGGSEQPLPANGVEIIWVQG